MNKTRLHDPGCSQHLQQHYGFPLYCRYSLDRGRNSRDRDEPHENVLPHSWGEGQGEGMIRVFPSPYASIMYEKGLKIS